MIIPSIDLSQGKAVQLRQGREKILERDDPLALAKEFLRFGEIAVVDLDAVLGKGSNDAVIEEICRIGECRVGGGIRSVKRAREILNMGAEKIIVGTKAFEDHKVNHNFLKELISSVGRERMIIALDSRNGEIVTDGWRSKTGLKFQTVLEETEGYASEYLFTCVEKEGMMEGTNLDVIKELQSKTNLPLTVAGGISFLKEIQSLSELKLNVQLGMSLYTGKISLADAFIASIEWKNGLIPTIAVDKASQVLMLAFSSKESLRTTFKTGKVWYYSRSRRRLWMKGEKSQNTQDFIKIRLDCDGDSLLVTVSQKGHACHRGSYSCFGHREFSLQELYEFLEDRIGNPLPVSYTSKLTFDKVKMKIMEEAQELIEAESNEDVIWASADLLYFLCVWLAKRGVSLESVLKELKRRRRVLNVMNDENLRRRL